MTDDAVRLARIQNSGGLPVNAIARHDDDGKWRIYFELDNGITVSSASVEFDSLDEARKVVQYAWGDIATRLYR